MVIHSLVNHSCSTGVTPLIARRQVKPGGTISMDSDNLGGRNKAKVVFVIGATGTGKSRLSMDLAGHFPAEIINSDKMQVYEGLDIVTNKVTGEERSGILHHLLGVIDPDADFTASDFRRRASLAVESILSRGRLPIVAGGSNSYIEALVDGGGEKFRSRHSCCFLWVDVSLPVLHSFVSERVDQMVEAGLIDEVRRVFKPHADYTRGIRRAIGVREMDDYLRMEPTADGATRARLLEAAVNEIKANTCKLATCQLKKIRRLQALSGWDVHRVDATDVFRKRGVEADVAWKKLVEKPSVEIVRSFLHHNQGDGDEDDDKVVGWFGNVVAAASVSVATAAAVGGAGWVWRVLRCVPRVGWISIKREWLLSGPLFVVVVRVLCGRSTEKAGVSMAGDSGRIKL